MKAFLLYKDRDFETAFLDYKDYRDFVLKREFLPDEQDLTQDLELNTLFEAMAAGDKFLFEVARHGVLSSTSDLETIAYRQGILKDCLEHPSLVRSIYDIAVEAIDREKKNYWSSLSNYPGYVLSRCVETLQMFLEMLRKLSNIADREASLLESEGFRALFARVRTELDDQFFAEAYHHLKTLRFRNGVLISAKLGKGVKGVSHVLRKPHPKQSWFKEIFAEKPPSYTYHLHPRDEAGARALSEMRDLGINLVANALAQSTEHILSFFKMLRAELGFYIACLNLHERLTQKGEPLCFPVPATAGERRHSFIGLYDVCLALSIDRRVVGNDVIADGKDLTVITGANKGGKSVFLRGVGLAQLMMQCGMFVPAEAFSANVCEGVFTHYKREEDTTMRSGKFDEELSRMSGIADHLKPNSLMLFNESFAATNEREGSEIASQITRALLDCRIKIFYVTHLYEFARSFYDKHLDNAIFLRANRQEDGSRTFKLIEAPPLETSYGEDLYKQIFGADDRTAAQVLDFKARSRAGAPSTPVRHP